MYSIDIYDVNSESLFTDLSYPPVIQPNHSQLQNLLTPDNLCVVFLKGNPHSQEFQHIRAQILQASPYLLLTLIHDTPTFSPDIPVQPQKQEGIIQIPQKDFDHLAARLVRDLYLSVSETGLIGIDVADLRTVCGKRKFVPFFVDTPSMDEPVSEMCNLPTLLHRAPPSPRSFSACYGALFYTDQDDACSIEHISEVMNMFHTPMSEDADVYCSALIRNDMEIPFRITGIVAF